MSAEDVYTALLADNASAVRPGAAGTATFTVQGREARRAVGSAPQCGVEAGTGISDLPLVRVEGYVMSQVLGAYLPVPYAPEL